MKKINIFLSQMHLELSKFMDHNGKFQNPLKNSNLNPSIFEVLNTFENIMENGAFAPKEQIIF